MTPQELKASILQLAIQGKLVEQRPEEGTGGELLRDILTQRRRGAECAEKKLTRRRGERGEKADAAAISSPGCPVRPVSPVPPADAPFDIPESWVWVRLGEVVDILDSMRRPITKADRKPGPYPYYGASCIQDYVADYIFDEPLVLLGEDGAKWERGDNSAYRISGKTWVNNHAHVLRPLGGVEHAYLVHALCISDLTSFVTGTTVPKLNQARMCGIPIPLPPLAEQKRIVAKIEELLPYIDRYEKAWSKLEDFNKRFPGDMQKSLLQMAIQGKLVDQRPEEGTGEELLEKILAAKGVKGANDAGKILTRRRGGRGAGLPSKNISAHSAPPREEIPDSEKPFDIPESWAWVRLGEIMLDVSTGPFGSMLHKADYCDGGIPLVNPMNIQAGRIVPSDNMRVSAKTAERLSSYRLSEGMVVVARRGELGRCASVGKDQEGWLCGTGSFFLNPSKELFVPFVTLIISSPYARQLFAGKAVGTTMANLNHSLLKALPIPLPPLAEQKRIVAKLEELLPLCERLK